MGTWIQLFGMTLLIVMIWFFMGSFFTIRIGSDSIAETILAGFVFYYFLFEFPGFICMILGVKLSVLTRIWFAIVALFVLLSLLLTTKSWYKSLIKRKRWLPLKNILFWIALAQILFQMVVVAMTPDESYDSAYYVANVTTNVDTDTINVYEPFTGAPYQYFYVRYLFGLYPVANSVFCQAFGVHPLIYTKTILFVVAVFLAYLLYYLIGRELFDGKENETFLFVILSCVANLFFHSLYSNSSFLLTRGYEGKAVLCNILIPYVWYLGILLWKEKKQSMCWKILAMIGIAGIDLTMSSMLILPILISAVLLPMLWVRKQKNLWLGWILVMIPSILLFLVYFLASRGVISFPVPVS